MSKSTRYNATLPLLLRTNPGAESPELPYIDSSESLLVAMSRATGAYFAANDFPHDAINTTLMRIESLALVMQCHLDTDEGVTPSVLSNVAWTVEGLATDALTLCRIWGRHATVNQGGNQSSNKYGDQAPESSDLSDES